MTILHRGAEALIILEKGNVVKRRIKKSYRLPQLDEKIRRQRTSLESKSLIKARRFGISVPRVMEIKECDIIMEWIDGDRVKDILDDLRKNKRESLYEQIGEVVAALHLAGIMHGDLTTSNMMVKDDTLTIIDFGLAKNSSRVEDQAVDLFLLYEALKAGHFSLLDEAWKGIMKAYKRNYSNAKQVLEQMEKIKQRRRYKRE